MKKYYMEDSDGVQLEIDHSIIKNIIIDYLANRYYWAFGIFCGIIGFLLGVIA